MAGKYVKHGAYRDHLAALQPLLAGAGLASEAKLVVLYGTSELLLAESVRALREKAVVSGAVITALEATAITESVLTSLTQQESLFEPTTLYVIRRAEAAKNLAKVLGALASSKALPNHLCFVYQGDAPAAALKTVLTKLKAKLVPCFAPWPNEIPQVLVALAETVGLKLSPDATQLMLAANGDDLTKNHNELRKLACVFGTTGSGKPLSAADIAQHLGLLREEDALQLDRLLLQQHWAKAYALAANLLARGEKALPLIAILAGHCRTMLRLTEAAARGVSPQGMAAAANVPPFILKTYLPYLNRAADPRRYVQALGRCQEADVLLKSRPLSEDLVVSRVIDALALT